MSVSPDRESSHNPYASVEHPGKSLVPDFLWTYANHHATLVDAAADLQRYLTEIATEASIPFHSIDARPKSLASYSAKALKTTADGVPKYTDPASQIQDCVAARVILYTMRARDDFANILSARVVCSERVNPGTQKHNGYDSEHFIATSLNDRSVETRYAALTNFLAIYPGIEIQLRSVAAHAWAEYEHDIRYKSGAYDDLPASSKGQVDQFFIEAGGLRRLMDETFDKIQQILYPEQAPQATADDDTDDLAAALDGVNETEHIALDHDALTAVITERFPKSKIGDESSRNELLHHLKLVDVRTVGQLESCLSELESGHVAHLMDYPTPPTGVRQLDDEILAALTDRYVDAAEDDNRRQLLRVRLARVRGKFRIYSIQAHGVTHRPVTAARAVRDLAKIIAEARGLEAAVVEGAVAVEPSEINPSSHAREVETEMGSLYVATNLTRNWAEHVMRRLVRAAPDSHIRVLRAGDAI